MRKVFYFTRLALLVGMLVGLVLLVLHSREPVYDGEPLSFWLDETLQDGWHRAEAENAIRTIGTNALPPLLERVRCRNSALRSSLTNLSARQTWVPIPVRPRTEILTTAYNGFAALGASAKPAVPALTRLLEDEDEEVRSCAAASLGAIGPAAQDAVPGLVKYLSGVFKKHSGTSTDSYELMGAAFALGEIGSAARPAIPQLTALSTLTNTGYGVRAHAKAALIKIKGDPQMLLTDVIKDPADGSAWNEKGMVIYLMGTNAEPAIPFLLNILQPTNSPFFQPRALQLLGRIHARPEICIPAVTPLLHSTNEAVQLAAMQCIRDFGGFKRCLPPAELEKCAQNPYHWVRVEALAALRQIKQEASEKSQL